ncbi:hypothetical protein [Absidia glauca]|uniref:Uncharacterized protein n=1 Tax=Absidia glauca TaxID=4829 RepID=A0A168P8R7_ABSGL|nr:hypothetical protein [Absidia glauca]
MTNHTPTSSKLKRILPKKSKVNVSPLSQVTDDIRSGKDLAMSKNTSPILQPPQPPYGNYSAKPSSRNIKGSMPTTTRTSSISCNTKVPVTMATPVSRSRRSHSLHYTSQPTSLLLNQATARSPSPPPPLPLSPLANTITYQSIPSHKKTTNTTKPSKMKLKRHSISSTTHPHKQAQPQRSRTLILEDEMKKQSPRTPSAAAVAALTPTAPSRLLSKAPVTPPSPSRPTPSLPSLQKSRSTPLRPFSKIKTYNVSSTPLKPTPSTSTSASTQRHRSVRTPSSRLERGLEKKKRQQELEDLISGRRGSTLKLSLTPKHTLMT